MLVCYYQTAPPTTTVQIPADSAAKDENSRQRRQRRHQQTVPPMTTIQILADSVANDDNADTKVFAKMGLFLQKTDELTIVN